MNYNPYNYNPYYNQQPQRQYSPMSNRGVFVYVNDYQEVVNTPTSADGNATLFVNLEQGIIWSKKFINGTNSIQAFRISPLNNLENNPTEEKKVDINVIITKLNELNERLSKLEQPKGE